LSLPLFQVELFFKNRNQDIVAGSYKSPEEKNRDERYKSRITVLFDFRIHAGIGV